MGNHCEGKESQSFSGSSDSNYGSLLQNTTYTKPPRLRYFTVPSYREKNAVRRKNYYNLLYRFVSEKNPCQPNPCKSSGSCTISDEDEGFQCICSSGNKGKRCECKILSNEDSTLNVQLQRVSFNMYIEGVDGGRSKSASPYVGPFSERSFSLEFKQKSILPRATLVYWMNYHHAKLHGA